MVSMEERGRIVESSDFEMVFNLRVKEVVEDYVKRFLEGKFDSEILRSVIDRGVGEVFDVLVDINSVDSFVKLFVDDKIDENERKVRAIAFLVILDAIVFNKVIAWSRMVLQSIIQNSCRHCLERFLQNGILVDIDAYCSSVGFLLGFGGWVLRKDGFDVDLFLMRLDEEMLRAVYLAIGAILIFCSKISMLIEENSKKERIH